MSYCSVEALPESPDTSKDFVFHFILGIKGWIYDVKQAVQEQLWPVGSIYMTLNNDMASRPAYAIGGIWERIEGVFLLGANTEEAGGTYVAGKTGGSASHTHTSTGRAHICAGSLSTGGYAIMQEQVYFGTGYTINRTYTASGQNVNYSPSSDLSKATTATNVTITNSTNSNLPPYLVVYMWKRIS